MEQLYLLATLAGARIAVDASEVEAVVKLTEISPVPGMGVHVAGLSALRSRVLTIIDVAALIHGRAQDAQVLTQAFPKAHSVAMQPISKPDRPGWLDFGGQARPVLKPKAVAPDAGPNEEASSQP